MRVLGLAILALMTVLVQPATSLLASTNFTVNTAADTTDGACTPEPGGCTLREAIEAANANGNPGVEDTISFAIPGEGRHTIFIGSGNPRTADLPPLLQAVHIDGTTQPGSTCTPLHPMIEIDGRNVSGDGFGLNFVGGPSRARGLSISMFGTEVIMQGIGSHHIECSQVGVNAAGDTVRWKSPEYPLVRVTSNGNFIGGLEPGAGNLLAGATGIVVATGYANHIEGNALGLPGVPFEPAATDQVALVGLSIGAASSNVIEGNSFHSWQASIEGLNPEPWIRDIGVIARNRISCGLEPELWFDAGRVGLHFVGTGATVLENTVTNCSTAVHAEGTGGSTSNNHFSANGTAISLQGLMSDLSISDNLFEGNATGIEITAVTGKSDLWIFSNLLYGLTSGGIFPNRGIYVHDTGGHGSARVRIGFFEGGNIVTGMVHEGILLANARHVEVTANSIGAPFGGTQSSANQVGIRVTGDANDSGDQEDRVIIDWNNISGNSQAGILLEGGTSIIWGNTIASDDALDSSLLGQHIQDSGVVILGGRPTLYWNSIVGNRSGGIRATGWDAGSMELWENEIIGNGGPGVILSGGLGATLRNNTLEANAGGGIVVLAGDGIAILENNFGNNVGLAIDLGGDGVTPNDALDVDAGPNQLLNTPVFQGAERTRDGLRIRGTAPADSTVELYQVEQCDPSGYGEGIPLSLPLIPAGDGIFDFEYELPLASQEFLPGTVLSAIAHGSTGIDDMQRSSELAACFTVAWTDDLEFLSIVPSTVVVGTDGFGMEIRGRNLQPGDVIYWDEIPLETTVRAGDVIVGHVPGYLTQLLDRHVISIRRGDGARSNAIEFLVLQRPSADVDGHPGVDARDVLYVLNYVAQMYYACSPWPCQFDLDKDGRVTLADVLYIRRVVAGLIPE